ncbi:PadR family transcriptional regulator [Tumebacillus permanentifrigoris]|uniref:DNA-binding PadR family transcriptional regulator n=1 Tax=Tumebacillus permanentifrigoris TaxID=378543 RepID=A0A316DB42_9BACL|nr:PadR family transcriptional regulator [Tumebacillus permanentifrigoris]PWK14948.1 DNA-binding PadR family transcriptional regulator [Tumebacillus permanentifrigoris]
MYELYVLGELLSGPKHGYLLHAILKSALGPVRQISWGSLYPMIRRFEGEGLISPYEHRQEEGGRPRKVYELTEAGRARFQELMMEPLEYNLETEVVFQLKMLYFSHVTPEVRQSSLQQYLEYLEYNEEHIKGIYQSVSNNPHIPDEERVYGLRMIDYRRNGLVSSIQWVEREIARKG